MALASRHPFKDQSLPHSQRTLLLNSKLLPSKLDQALHGLAPHRASATLCKGDPELGLVLQHEVARTEGSATKQDSQNTITAATAMMSTR
jgi:hypothetical protein